MKLEPKNNITVRRRIVALLLIIFLVQTFIIGRYAYIQIVWSPKLQQFAIDQWTSDTRIAAKRGKILDRNERPLAVSGNVERIDAFLKEVNAAEKAEGDKKITKEEIAAQIAPILGLSEEYIVKKLNSKLKNGLPMSSASIARRIERDVADKIRKLDLPGIVITEDTKRYYPNGNFLAQVLGSINSDGEGRSGLEFFYNDELDGVPGRFVGETDAYHREMANSLTNYISPINGNDLVLTIDESIQYFTEKAIDKGLIDNKAKQITAIVMDPKTGEVLAMANKPDFDPNNAAPSSLTKEQFMETWKNRAINENFEPGSILKVITAAAAIEENLVSDKDRFYCRGSLKVTKGVSIKCWKAGGHGEQTFAQILQNSCNVGFMELGKKLGKTTLHKYYDAFGLGKRTNVDYPGEERGIILPVDKVQDVELATEAFGQGIAVTAIQYMAALNAVANDGKMVEPHLVKKIIHTDEDGNTSVVREIETKQVKQVISVETARKLRGIMETVVTVGAGKNAYLEGYHVGGKTGTAQVVENGKYVDKKYISTFIAMSPCNDPKFTIMVSIKEPDPSNYYSGSTAAPIAKVIMEDIIRYLEIQPDLEDVKNPKVVKKVIIPEVRGMSVADAQKLLKEKKINVNIQGTGNIVYDISPKPGISVKENTKIEMYLGVDKNENEKVYVPNFNTMTEKEIKEAASTLGLKVSLMGKGIGASQDITPGTVVEKGTTIKIILEEPVD